MIDTDDLEPGVEAPPALADAALEPRRSLFAPRGNRNYRIWLVQQRRRERIANQAEEPPEE